MLCAASSQGGSPRHALGAFSPGTPDNGSEGMPDASEGVPAEQHERLREEGDLIMLVRKLACAKSKPLVCAVHW